MLEAIAGTFGVAFLAVFGWAYTLSNRVLVVETSYNGLEELIEAKFDEVNRRLERIEAVMIGQIKGH
jgi:hypothetical protein